jgi:hypothetical protein
LIYLGLFDLVNCAVACVYTSLDFSTSVKNALNTLVHFWFFCVAPLPTQKKSFFGLPEKARGKTRIKTVLTRVITKVDWNSVTVWTLETTRYTCDQLAAHTNDPDEVITLD